MAVVRWVGVGLAPAAEPEALTSASGLRECVRLGEKGRRGGLGKGGGMRK
jgi:hypothetical protein